MSDATTADRIASITAGGECGTTLAADHIERILGEFREWLSRSPAVASPSAPPPLDLSTLIAQFTALRHEVNLQTKATRAVVEQTTQWMQKWSDGPIPAADIRRVWIKTFLDIADALTIAKRQMEHTLQSATHTDAAATDAPPSAPSAGGWLTRWWPASQACPERAALRAENQRLRQQLAAVVEGYALSLRRVETALPQFELEPIRCEGQPFDPELMEVVDTVADLTVAPGTVVEVVRVGYRWQGQLYRYAQVKVAKGTS